MEWEVYPDKKSCYNTVHDFWVDFSGCPEGAFELEPVEIPQKLIDAANASDNPDQFIERMIESARMVYECALDRRQVHFR